MKKNLKIFMLVGVLSFFLLSPALATYVDFRLFIPDPDPDNDNIVDSPYTHTLFGAITVTFENASDYGEKLWWDNLDGFGIYGPGYEKDEVEYPEKMRIRFSSPVYVNYFDLTDLYYEGSPEYEEIGWYNFNGDFGSSKNIFSQTDHLVLPSPASNGEYRLDINQIIGEIWFSSPGKLYCRQNHEFSVAALEASPIPEPATLLLIGSGLIGLAGVGRKKFFNK